MLGFDFEDIEPDAENNEQVEIVDLLTPEQLQILDESIKQADEGIFISHEEVLKRSAEWFKKSI